ncbi:MAG: hypothetical protein H0X40_18050 [Chthoniobacterales bacterium]|nr:hypothetical protein [Chthoniobacterales bacterium]
MPRFCRAIAAWGHPLDVGSWKLNVGRFLLLSVLLLSCALTSASTPEPSPEEKETLNAQRSTLNAQRPALKVQRPTPNVQRKDTSAAVHIQELELVQVILAQTSKAAPNEQRTAADNPAEHFNPDPGATPEPESIEPPSLFQPVIPPLPKYHDEPLPRSLRLPRRDMEDVVPLRRKLDYQNYPEAERGEGLLPGSEPVENRWFLGFGSWKRYADPSPETPYQSGGLKLWHPYLQSTLKGDAPIIGQDIFLNLTVSDFLQTEFRTLPTPSGVASARPNSSEFFGRSEQFSLSNDFSIAVDLFKGETAFKPVEWALHILGIYNSNYTDVQETNVLDPDPRLKNTTRFKDFYALQEAFAEIHIHDLSDNYDFISSRFGIQPFVSDFRGFIFNDSNLGVRIFGNYDNNRWQYNVAAFDMREKDTYSGLNSFDSRDQWVLVANVYRQDFLAKGYTAQLNFVADLDGAERHYDKNGFIVRPAPIGNVKDHSLSAYYLGWTGDGHIGWLNITHAFYEVLGEDEFNGIAGRRVTINAQMAALELSIDRDWLRQKISFFYASGDGNPKDGVATGFDTILDRPFLFGGPFSYYVHQGFNLAGTSVNFKQGDSLVPDFRTSKTEGQANFVNPGVFIAGYGLDADITPKLKAFVNINHIQTIHTEVTERVLFTQNADNDIGWDFSLGVQYRPFLTDNVIVTAGVGFLLPGEGYKEIYRANTRPVPGFGNPPAGNVDDFLYSGLVTVTLTY